MSKPYTRHELSKLRESIKNNADDTRVDRQEARELSGPARHNALEGAKNPETRELLLAYGILRGRTFSQMESEHSDPSNLPEWSGIASYCRAYAVGREGESSEEYKARLDAVLEAAEADYKAWKRSLTQSRLLREAQRRAA